MITLSVAEDRAVRDEADVLCNLISDHSYDLRHSKLGRRFRLAKHRFRLLKRDRNALYRISSRTTWFLKLPTRQPNDAIERERLGAEAVQNALKGMTNYNHAHAVRVSVDNRFVLYGAIPGRQLNHAFYRWQLTSLIGGLGKIERTFENLGDVLAQFHSYRSNTCSGKKYKTDRDTRAILQRIARASRIEAPIMQAILDWAESLTDIDDSEHQEALVHGNLQPHNILTRDSRVSLIDFENVGYGPVYRDLSVLCTAVMLTSTLPAFPKSGTRVALRSVLHAYGQTASFESRSLIHFTAMRLAKMYLEHYALKKRRLTVAGMPVARKKIDRLVDILIRWRELDVADLFNILALLDRKSS